MLMTNLNKVRQLSRKDRRLLLQSVLLLPVIHFALLLLGYHRLRGVMEKLIPLQSIDAPVSEMEIIQRAQEIARIVSTAAQHGLYKANCLRRSLLAWWFLRRQGIRSNICFGVRMNDQHLEAHAWVERNGIVLNDSGDVHKYYRLLNNVLPSTKLGL